MTFYLTLADGVGQCQQIISFHPETPAGFPEVIASMVNYVVKPESYFVTGEQTLQVCQMTSKFSLRLDSANAACRWRGSSFLTSGTNVKTKSEPSKKWIFDLISDGSPDESRLSPIGQGTSAKWVIMYVVQYVECRYYFPDMCNFHFFCYLHIWASNVQLTKFEEVNLFIP